MAVVNYEFLKGTINEIAKTEHAMTLDNVEIWASMWIKKPSLKSMKNYGG